MRKCGLKPTYASEAANGVAVTSLAEVWIETQGIGKGIASGQVTSLAEVWIETGNGLRCRKNRRSHFPCGSVD